MARQKGIIRLSGSIGDVTFIHGKYGDLAKKKSGITRERIMTDPCFQGMRDNMAETGIIAKCSGLMLDTVAQLAARARDSEVHCRLMKVFREMKDLDLESGNGKRNPGAALLQNPAAAHLLRGFEFNDRTHLSWLLVCQPVVDKETGIVTLPELDVREYLKFPSGATHAFVTAGWARLDLTNMTGTFSASEPAILAWNCPKQDVVLVPPVIPFGEGVTVYLLRVGFAQVVNGVYSPFEGGKANVLTVVEIAN